MIRKWGKPLPRLSAVDCRLLGEEQAWELLRLVADWPDLVVQAARELDPSRVAVALYELAKSFSRFYHDLPIITAETPALAEARLALSEAVRQVLRQGFHLLNIPYLEAM
jgi:arginyl-tRNA synthetase